MDSFIEFDGYGQRSGPLTWGQRMIWEVVAQAATNAFYNLDRELVVPRRASASLDDVVQAVRALVRRHESLRSTVELRDGEPYQVVADRGRLPLTVVESGGNESAAATECRGRLAERRFDSLRELPLRLGAIVTDGQVRRVVLVINHLAADSHGCDVLLRDLRLLLLRGALPGAPGLQPVDLARRQHADGRSTIRALRYWRDRYRRIPPTMFEPTGSAGTPPFHRLALVSPAAADASAVIAARHHVSTSTVLLVAATRLVGRWTGHRLTAMQLFVDNRFRPGLRDMVAPLTQFGLFVMDLTDDPDLDRLVATYHPVALDAYRHAYYDEVSVRRGLTEVRLARGVDVNPYCCFNDVRTTVEVAGPLQPPRRPGVRTVDESDLTWLEPAAWHHCRFCVVVHSAPGGLQLRLGADTRVMSRVDMPRFLLELEASLVETAVSPTRAR
ncbi:condensation domain-containing protein [Plantactinospora sp. WMMB782]|uniref:condensation domain-containing protein n=1 Tax=Plantactinospora sp. WMMB782 TaxID=3404121 RepID=UPI003B93255C